MCFAPETWDGSDMFVPADTGFVMVTEKVVDALMAAKITGVAIAAAAGIEHGNFTYG